MGITYLPFGKKTIYREKRSQSTKEARYQIIGCSDLKRILKKLRGFPKENLSHLP